MEMTKIEFKTLVDTHFKLKMHENGWKGTYNDFRKLDDRYVIKMFGIHKDLTENQFRCNLGLDFQLSSNFPKNIPKILNNGNCLFVNTITPSEVSDNNYNWAISENESENIATLETLHHAMITHGEHFYRNFENFPKPFEAIMPSEFENGIEVKLLNKYYVGDQVGFLKLLKNVNKFTDNHTVARQFSEIGVARVRNSMEKVAATTGLSKELEKIYKKLLKSLEM